MYGEKELWIVVFLWKIKKKESPILVIRINALSLCGLMCHNEMKVMKKVLVLLLTPLFVFCSCQTRSPQYTVQRGDLLFVALPYDYNAESLEESSEIRNFVAQFQKEDCLISDTLNLIHGAILDVVDDSLFVIDATLRRGVERYPWADFVKDFTLHDGSLPTFFVCRLNDTSEVDRFIANACRFIGQPYDMAFAPDNAAMYCTELIRESYVTADGDTLFAQTPIDFRAPNGDMPPYWRKMFKKVGISPEEMGIGTCPKTMIYAPCIHLVDVELPYVEPAKKVSFSSQKDTLVQGLGPELYSRVTPRDITVLDAYYYAFETSDGTRESNAVYTFLNHDTADPSYYGIFSEDSLKKVFAAERRYRTPVDANVERGEVEPSIADLEGFWVHVQPFGESFVFDNHWDFIPAVRVLSNQVEFLTMDGVWTQDIMEFHRFDDGSFVLRLDADRPDFYSGRFELVDASHRVYGLVDDNRRFFITPAVKAGETPFEVVEYACRVPEILDSYFTEN